MIGFLLFIQEIALAQSSFYVSTSGSDDSHGCSVVISLKTNAMIRDVVWMPQRRVFVASRNLVFDFELFIGERCHCARTLRLFFCP